MARWINPITGEQERPHFFAPPSCRFALDNFGTGFTSYGQLKKLPVQMLKVDGPLV